MNLPTENVECPACGCLIKIEKSPPNQLSPELHQIIGALTARIGALTARIRHIENRLNEMEDKRVS